VSEAVPDVPSGTGAADGPLVARLLAGYCARNGLRFVLEPETGFAGYIQVSNGRRSYFKGTHFDLNALGASEIARDKAYTAHFLAEAGLRVPRGLLVSAPRSIKATRAKQLPHADLMKTPAAATGFAEEAGFPLFAKPNDAREGIDVRRFASPYQLETGLSDLLSRHDNALLQEAVAGRDLRFMVLEGDVLCVIERTVPGITGDGRRTVEELSASLPRQTLADPRLSMELAGQGLDLQSVPDIGRIVRLLPNANLSAGGSGRAITDDVCDALRKIAIAAAQTVGLAYCGVDMIVTDPADPESDHAILEVNAAPGLSRFARLGPNEAALVERIYERVFDEIGRKLTD
jgi:glutathione synthase/RimK-type ligase-like ATP-grasp enzyme